MARDDYWDRPDRLVRLVPRRRDDLKPEVLDWVDGQPFVVQFVGTMDEGDYEGETMWSPVRDEPGPRCGWMPDCDLVDVPVEPVLESRL